MTRFRLLGRAVSTASGSGPHAKGQGGQGGSAAQKGCRNRSYRDQSADLRSKLGRLQNKRITRANDVNLMERQYHDFGYSGSFHKTLLHDSNGTLQDTVGYETMRKAIICNLQKTLANVALAPGATMRLVNPLASWSTPLIGRSMNGFTINAAPILSSNA